MKTTILTRNREEEEEDCASVCLPILSKSIYNYCPFMQNTDFIALDLEQEQEAEKGGNSDALDFIPLEVEETLETKVQLFNSTADYDYGDDQIIPQYSKEWKTVPLEIEEEGKEGRVESEADSFSPCNSYEESNSSVFPEEVEEDVVLQDSDEESTTDDQEWRSYIHKKKFCYY